MMLTGASLAEGGWRVQSNMLELPRAGGLGGAVRTATG